MSGKKEEGKIFFTTYHHADLTWMFSYEAYDEIREQQLDIVLGFFQKYPEYGFFVDQAYVLQNYLERNPDRLETVKKYVMDGKGPFELFGGWSIPDLNMCSGESFLRNCIMGQEYYRNTFGVTPHITSLDDAFGMPAQTPQVLKKLGYQYLIPGRTPNMPPSLAAEKAFHWLGADGTGIVAVTNGMGVDKTSHLTNLPVTLSESQRFDQTMADLQNTQGNIVGHYVTEYQMFDEAFFRHLERANNNPNAPRKITFGRFADYCDTIEQEQLQVFQNEFNPAFTGCYTTRIGVKQKIRKAETALFNAELAGVLTGQPIHVSDSWKQFGLAQCHDSVCGCHHDICNDDIHEKLDFVVESAEKQWKHTHGCAHGDTLLVMNPSSFEGEQLVETTPDALPQGLPVQQSGERYYFSAKLPAHGMRQFSLGKDLAAKADKPLDLTAYCGETDCYTFDFSGTMPVIVSKRYGHSVFGKENFGEILFRHEGGTLWTEILNEKAYGAEYQQERVTQVEEGPVFIKVTTQGSVKPGKVPLSGNFGNYWPGFDSLSYQKEYLFPLHLPYFKLEISLNFTGSNTKILLRIPVELDPGQATALYDTPFAATARKPYFEVPYEYEATRTVLENAFNYASAKGDYPALNWVDYCDQNIGLTVANNGTPGHQLVGKNIFVSLLRSPTSCMNGMMYPQPGAHDNGLHTYEFAFTDHLPENTPEASRLGNMLNRQPVCLKTACTGTPSDFMLRFDRDNIVVSSVYQNEAGIVVRAYEGFGFQTTCGMDCGTEKICFAADFYGNAQEQQDRNQIQFAPYEIKTFLLKAP